MSLKFNNTHFAHWWDYLPTENPYFQTLKAQSDEDPNFKFPKWITESKVKST